MLVWEETGQFIPSIVTVITAPKFVPVIVIVSPPALDPKVGDIKLMIDVCECL